MDAGTAEKRRFGFSDSEWVLLTDTVLNPLRRLGAEVWIFGSRARGTHRPFSDLDILFNFTTPPPNYRAQIFEINSNAENSNLPIKIDLVEEKDLAESFRANVLRDRVKVE